MNSESALGSLVYNNVCVKELGFFIHRTADSILHMTVKSLQSVQQQTRFIKHFTIKPDCSPRESLGRLRCLTTILSRSQDWTNENNTILQYLVKEVLPQISLGLQQCCSIIIMHSPQLGQTKDVPLSSLYHQIWGQLCLFITVINEDVCSTLEETLFKMLVSTNNIENQLSIDLLVFIFSTSAIGYKKHLIQIIGSMVSYSDAQIIVVAFSGIKQRFWNSS